MTQESRGGGRGRRGPPRGRGRGRAGRGRHYAPNAAKDGNTTSIETTAAKGNRGGGGRGRSGRGRGGGGGRKNPNQDGAKADNDKVETATPTNADGNKQQNKNTKNKAGGKDGKSQKSANENKKGKNKTQSKGNQAKGSKDPKPDNQSFEESKKKENAKGGESNQSNNKNKPKGNSQKNEKKKETLPLMPSIPPSQPQQTSDINYGRGQSITVLHVAEKPSIAQAIANALAKGNSNYRSKTLPVHEFTGPAFPKAPHAASCKHKVTSVAGHVYSVDFPAKYQSWDSTDPAELFRAPIQRKPTKGSTVKHLSDEGKGCDFICLWLDCDREGENIAFEVLDCCMHNMKGGGNHFDRVYRAYFSAISPSDIHKAYQALGKPDKNQSLSVDARQELDLKVGVAFSRFQTRYFQGRYGDLDSSVLSYGPCQTPTLGFCVQRHVDIETFKPEPYWTVELCVMKRGRALRALWDSGRSFNKSKVEKLIEDALEVGPVARVKSVVTKDKKQGRPIPLNTVGLLKACSKALGIGPHSALQTGE